MNSSYKHFHRIAWAALLLALCVVVFGSFVRLSNAGLSCPDWPTCYGRAAWPTQESPIAQHAAEAIRAVDTSKAWREQLHRHLAASLGLLVLVLSLLEAKRKTKAIWVPIVASLAVSLAIPLYMQGQYYVASALVSAGVLSLLGLAYRADENNFIRATSVLLAVIICQAILGMWTVTWLLKPIVVMAHLLGGLTTFGLLTWLAWRATPNHALIHSEARSLKIGLAVGLLLLVIQIALGGWTSANYAALSCGADFPKCMGQWLPAHDFREAFVLWRGVGVDYEGGVLDGPARVAIQLAHRGMAVIVGLYLLWMAIKLLRTPGLVFWGTVLAVLVLAQIALGVSNVHFSLPLWVAVAHNAGAALLVFTLVGLLARINLPTPELILDAE